MKNRLLKFLLSTFYSRKTNNRNIVKYVLLQYMSHLILLLCPTLKYTGETYLTKFQGIIREYYEIGELDNLSLVIEQK